MTINGYDPNAGNNNYDVNAVYRLPPEILGDNKVTQDGYQAKIYDSYSPSNTSAVGASAMYRQGEAQNQLAAWAEVSSVKDEIESALIIENSRRQVQGLPPYESFEQMLSDPGSAQTVAELSKKTGLSAKSLLQADQVDRSTITNETIRQTRILAWEQQREDTQKSIWLGQLSSMRADNNLAKSSDSA